jgi:hypothetical protein
MNTTTQMEIVYLIYNPKDKGTFQSAKWMKDYSPDLSMITQDPEDNNYTRHISNGFSRNQHHPVSLQHGLRISLTRSVPKHRLNFTRADWDRFARDLDHVIQFIPAEFHMIRKGSDCCSQLSHSPWLSKSVHSGMESAM